jgi:hypothetical protein
MPIVPNVMVSGRPLPRNVYVSLSAVADELGAIRGLLEERRENDAQP